MDSMPNQQPNNLLSSEDGVTSLPYSGNHHHGRRIFFSILEQWRRFDNNVHQQQPNLLSSEDGVTSLPQRSNHYYHQLFYTVLQLWRRLDTDNIPYEQLLELQERIGRLNIGRLDTDNIPYEQLLELQERFGNVNSGLSEENIANCLKTRTVTSGDVKNEKIYNETCIVCQDEYNDNDTIGALECGHEYHRECIKKWLLLKTFCPICRRPALSTTN